jgi:putative integral membrane protein (TIGR02587 family)
VNRNAEYAQGLARAFGGALLFALPLLMTMEMWALGAAMERCRLAVYLLTGLPILLGLSYYAGFEQTFRLKDEILDALAAFAVGMLLSAGALSLFSVVGHGMPADEIVGKIVVCALPASIGALLAGKQFAMRQMDDTREKAEAGLLGKLFIMLVGALFLAFNVAPTEEMVLIAYKMAPWQGLLLMIGSIALLHVVVYGLGFPGEDERRGDASLRRTFLVYTAPGYAIALLVSYYALWTFTRLEGASLHERAMMTVVLAFPGALGAATARLVI